MAANPPIYDQLVQEHGDVVKEARDAAHQTQRQAENVLDWSGLRPPPPRDERR
ncbi:hypothetical protein NLX86_16955 [Streptomyces sp. A3M-1-3]|uniref:hypothetical protein n=1 Tax=Streptomyces sp. A3M-1-3 TaxID=2962044 RepID=UPI0020B79DD4|nr:hypothetical protein [Streptomyces sp. A3M-1-3]MCP3819725.1 hypothetical protein [Streptomyces sp. A3M-1-3]